MKRFKPKDFLGKYDLKIDIKNSEPACMQCLPPTPLKGHKTLHGVIIHTRIDCPKDTVYFINDDQFKK